MSVLKFLATGKSLVGMKDRATPYRMRPENLLPKFESSKNPFAAPVKCEAAPIAPELPLIESVRPLKASGETLSLFDTPKVDQTILAVETVPVVEKKSEPVKPAPPVAKAEPQPAAAPVVQNAVAAPAVAPIVVAAPVETVKRPTLVTAPKKISLLSLIKKLNPFTRLHPWSGNNSRSRAIRTPVQTELSLERIKVVRNDLNDADLEVITAKSGPASDAGKIAGSASSASSSVLNRLNSRFLSSRPTQVH